MAVAAAAVKPPQLQNLQLSSNSKRGSSDSGGGGRGEATAARPTLWLSFSSDAKIQFHTKLYIVRTSYRFELFFSNVQIFLIDKYIK